MSCLVHILQSYEWCLLFIHSSPAEATLIITLHSASTQRQAREVKTTFGSVLTWPDRTEYGVWEGGLLSRHGEDSLRQPVFVLTSIHCRYKGETEKGPWLSHTWYQNLLVGQPSLVVLVGWSRWWKCQDSAPNWLLCPSTTRVVLCSLI